MWSVKELSDKLHGLVSVWQTQQQGRTMGMREGHVGDVVEMGRGIMGRSVIKCRLSQKD